MKKTNYGSRFDWVLSLSAAVDLGGLVRAGAAEPGLEQVQETERLSWDPQDSRNWAHRAGPGAFRQFRERNL